MQKAYEKILEAEQATENSGSKQPQKTSAPPPTKGGEAMFQRFKPSPLPAPVDDMEHTVLDTVQASDDELRELAVQRARRVQGKIAESGKIPAERIYLMDVRPAASSNAARRVYFHLK